MSKRVLHVVTNVAHYDDANDPTGLWLSELTHAHDVFAEHGYVQTIVSPKGGVAPLEPRSLQWPNVDASAKTWRNDRSRMQLLDKTLAPESIVADDFDAIYYTGGHGVMWDFPDNAALQNIARSIYENGGVVASVCHGYCGLLNLVLSNGKHLVAERRLTGFSWTEEILAGVAKKVPYNAEAEIKKRGARYEKAWLPFVSKVVVDERLVTGQNPLSAHATAKEVTKLLRNRS